MKNDRECAAAVALLKACSDLLAVQRESQPEAYPRICSGVVGAVELRFEATVTIGTRAAHLRIATLDGQGEEMMLDRALDLVAPTSPALQ